MEFTEAERRTIDDIHKRNFEGLTPDEVQLYGRWCADVAAEKREIELRDDAFMAALAEQGAMYRAQAEEAKQRFNERLQKMRSKYDG